MRVEPAHKQFAIHGGVNVQDLMRPCNIGTSTATDLPTIVSASAGVACSISRKPVAAATVGIAAIPARSVEGSCFNRLETTAINSLGGHSLLLASDFGVTSLAAVAARNSAIYIWASVHRSPWCMLNLLTVARLGALSRLMAVLITVAALDLRHVLGLGALIGSVTLSITVAAYEFLLFRAVLRHVALLTAVEASTRTSTTALGTITSKVTSWEDITKLATVDIIRRGKEIGVNSLPPHFRHSTSSPATRSSGPKNTVRLVITRVLSQIAKGCLRDLQSAAL